MNTQQITEIPTIAQPRISTGIKDFNSFVGGGFVAGQTIIIAGQPGVGKSTLLLQLSSLLSNQTQRMLYISGEESMSQLKLRADRLNTLNDSIFISEDVELSDIYLNIEKFNPKFIIIDSLQMLYDKTTKGEEGGNTQMKHCSMSLVKHAKASGRVLIFIGHATKGGTLAGLLKIQHMVDTVLYISKDEQGTRYIVAKKNRFGTVDEVFQMHMKAEGFKELNDIVRTKGTQLPPKETMDQFRAKYGNEVTFSKQVLLGQINNKLIKLLLNSVVDFLERKIFGRVLGVNYRITFLLDEHFNS